MSELLIATFSEFVAPECEPQGVEEFGRLVDPAALAERERDGRLFLVAVEGNRLVGVLELRDDRHLSLLFVAQAAQGRGVGRELFGRALAIARQARSDPAPVTVNSSRYAVGFYEGLGFERQGEEKVENGFVLVPMARRLRR